MVDGREFITDIQFTHRIRIATPHIELAINPKLMAKFPEFNLGVLVQCQNPLDSVNFPGGAHIYTTHFKNTQAKKLKIDCPDIIYTSNIAGQKYIKFSFIISTKFSSDFLELYNSKICSSESPYVYIAFVPLIEP